MGKRLIPADNLSLRSFGYDIVFEGSQGLLLDENHRFFPHVTHAKTGLPNILTICEEAGIEELEAIYVLRSYMTRHGHGPFPTENKKLSYDDDTNVSHDWQGNIRFGTVDADLIREAISNDLSTWSAVKVTPSLAVTHLDQTDSNVLFRDQGVDCWTHWVDFGRRFNEHIPIHTFYAAAGPRRENVMPMGINSLKESTIESPLVAA
jgi:adenylosuccinate synthase